MKRKNLPKYVLAYVGLAGFAVAVEASVVTVSPGNMNGWSFFNYTGSAPNPDGQMVTGPAGQPYGTGSAQLMTGAGGGDGSVGITTGAYDGTKLSSITSISYYADSVVNNGSQFPYLAINVNLNDGSGKSDTLFFEPPYQTPAAGGLSDGSLNQTTTMNTWQFWNAVAGAWWDNNKVLGSAHIPYGGYNGVGTLAQFEALFPNATIANTPYAGIDGIALQVGFGEAGDNFTGYVDGVTVNSTTYDFEPAAPVPEPTTMIAGALLLVPFGASALRILRKKQTA